MKNIDDIRCPISLFAQIFDDKWKLFIVFNLLENQKRFKELCELCNSYITQKTLSIKLKELESHGIILRTVFSEIPPRVEYSLSDKGKELECILQNIKTWGLKHYCFEQKECVDKSNISFLNLDF